MAVNKAMDQLGWGICLSINGCPQSKCPRTTARMGGIVRRQGGIFSMQTVNSKPPWPALGVG